MGRYQTHLSSINLSGIKYYLYLYVKEDYRVPWALLCLCYKVCFVWRNANKFIIALVRLLSCFSMDLQYSCFAQEGGGVFSTHLFVAGGGCT